MHGTNQDAEGFYEEAKMPEPMLSFSAEELIVKKYKKHYKESDDEVNIAQNVSQKIRRKFWKKAIQHDNKK